MELYFALSFSEDEFLYKRDLSLHTHFLFDVSCRAVYCAKKIFVVCLCLVLSICMWFHLAVWIMKNAHWLIDLQVVMKKRTAWMHKYNRDMKKSQQ